MVEIETTITVRTSEDIDVEKYKLELADKLEQIAWGADTSDPDAIVSDPPDEVWTILLLVYELRGEN